MKKLIPCCVLLVVCTLAAPYLKIEGRLVNVDHRPIYESEFYWDDGELSRAWCWFSAGNYWAVQFDEEKTEGTDRGMIEALGAVAYPNWPDPVFQGAYIHIFEDDAGQPGASIYNELLVFTTGNLYEWLIMEQHVYGAVFYVAYEQYGDYPNCDALGVDAVSGTHNWTCNYGSWEQTSAFSDFMLRCYWQPFSEVTETSWGQVKALY